MVRLKMLILTSLLIAFACMASTAHAELIDLSACRSTKFKVTSYYSPLPDQDFYYRGNHADEVILNWQGTHGASGRPVFNGMIAAPKTYAFGTKIYFPGFGIGQVEDRGGAIVNKWERGEEYDRIDFWVGAGEEGLMRALSFGVKYLDAYVCEQPTSDHVGFDMEKFPIFSDFFAKSLWMLQLEKGRTDPWVEVLQKVLSQMNYFPSDRVTGYFGPVTEQAVCNFQQDYLGISEDSIWCGYFGPQTRWALYSAVLNNGLNTLAFAGDDQLSLASEDADIPVVKPLPEPEPEPELVTDPVADDVVEEVQLVDEPAEEDTKVEIELTLNDEINQYYLSIGDSTRYQFYNPIRLWDKGKEVKLLQRKLQWLGYYEDRISGTYDTTTSQAIFAFQLDMGILQGDEDASLFGYFGPQTRARINKL